jgi:hypothetical protein
MADAHLQGTVLTAIGSESADHIEIIVWASINRRSEWVLGWARNAGR